MDSTIKPSEFRALIEELLSKQVEISPEHGRYLSLVNTKLEEALLWAGMISE